MKQNTVITTALILIAIFNIAIGMNYLPLWAIIAIETISIFLLVHILANRHKMEKDTLYKRIQALEDNINEATSDLKSQLESQHNHLTNKIEAVKDATDMRLNEITNISNSIFQATGHVASEITNESNSLKGHMTEESSKIAQLISAGINDINGKNESLNCSLKNSFSDEIISAKEVLKAYISNSLQESQATTRIEHDRLQVLLRTILKNIAHTANTIGYSTPNPNRTETIVDDETKNYVYNSYRNGELTKSTMKDSKGNTLYEIEYHNKKIARSWNYGPNGEVNIEQTFHENGQVHYRHEYTPQGKITTEFEPNGKKK